MTGIPIKPTEADVTLFLAFITDQRAYHNQRIKDFPPEDALMHAIHAAHNAALDAMTAMAGAGHHPRQICLALVAAAGNAAGRMSYYAGDSSLPLMAAQTLIAELNQGIAKQQELEAASGRPS